MAFTADNNFLTVGGMVVAALATLLASRYKFRKAKIEPPTAEQVLVDAAKTFMAGAMEQVKNLQEQLKELQIELSVERKLRSDLEKQCDRLETEVESLKTALTAVGCRYPAVASRGAPSDSPEQP